MSKYLNIQNKALHQGLYLAYVMLPKASIPYTTNGHIMVRGKVHEVKPIKAQEDRRDMELTVLSNPEWLADLNDMTPVEMLLHDDKEVEANGIYYQKLYVQYIMARYQVSEWKTGGTKLVAVDEKDNIIAIIAPMKGDNQ